MDKPRPYVTAALICEKVLQEKDGSLTLVRIADNVHYSLQGVGVKLPEGLKPMFNIQGLVSLKSGPVTGEHTIKVVVENPRGERKELFTFPVTFLGGDQGQNLVLSMGLGADQDGLYWFDVLFDEEMLTRVPLMVIPAQDQASKAANT